MENLTDKDLLKISIFNELHNTDETITCKSTLMIINEPIDNQGTMRSSIIGKMSPADLMKMACESVRASLVHVRSKCHDEKTKTLATNMFLEQLLSTIDDVLPDTEEKEGTN